MVCPFGGEEELLHGDGEPHGGDFPPPVLEREPKKEPLKTLETEEKITDEAIIKDQIRKAEQALEEVIAQLGKGVVPKTAEVRAARLPSTGVVPEGVPGPGSVFVPGGRRVRVNVRGPRFTEFIRIQLGNVAQKVDARSVGREVADAILSRTTRAATGRGNVLSEVAMAVAEEANAAATQHAVSIGVEKGVPDWLRNVVGGGAVAGAALVAEGHRRSVSGKRGTASSFGPELKPAKRSGGIRPARPAPASGPGFFFDQAAAVRKMMQR